MSPAPKELFRLKRDFGAFEVVLILLFFAWGIAGFVLIMLDVMSAASQKNSAGVGVGTINYVAMEILFWVGGMLLFGLSAVIAGGHFTLLKDEEPPASK